MTKPGIRGSRGDYQSPACAFRNVFGRFIIAPTKNDVVSSCIVHSCVCPVGIQSLFLEIQKELTIVNPPAIMCPWKQHPGVFASRVFLPTYYKQGSASVHGGHAPLRSTHARGRSKVTAGSRPARVAGEKIRGGRHHRDSYKEGLLLPLFLFAEVYGYCMV